MNQELTERPISGMSTAATDGGTKPRPRLRIARQVLVDIGTCIYCETRKAEYTVKVGHGHHREQVQVCGPCYKTVPLQTIAAHVFGKREGGAVGCLFQGQPEYDVDEVVRQKGATS